MSVPRHLVNRASRCRVLVPLPSPPVRAPRLSRRAASTTTTAAPPPASPRPSPVVRVASFTAQALLFTALGFIMATAPAYEEVKAIFSPASTVTAPPPPSHPDTQEKEDFIESLPLTAEMRAKPEFIEVRTHTRLPPSWRDVNLTAGALAGPGRMATVPYTWVEKDGRSLVQVFHAGKDLCGHVGVLHGGFVATMLDEGMGICCFPALPSNVGMTARLEINYKAPALADQYLVLRAATTKVEGRKAWVEAHIETLPKQEGEEPVVLATGTALYISPKQAATMAKILPASLTTR